MMHQQCSICVNSNRNPTIPILESGACRICDWYNCNYSRSNLIIEQSFLNGKSAIVEMTGGKDSSAVAWFAKTMNLKLSAFTFDTGYYPKHTFTRACEQAGRLGLHHEIIDIRKYIQPDIRECYHLTASLFDDPPRRTDALEIYSLNRHHYAANDTTIMPYIRPCQLCRKIVVPAYYREALKRNVQLVILGMNEWTHLNGYGSVSGIRKLQPDETRPPIWVVHLPFLMGWNLIHNQNISRANEWTPPEDEAYVETNGNSCLFARASEVAATKMLGFHPDTTRLAREVTAGFLTKTIASAALATVHEHDKTVRQVLMDADII